MPYNAHRPPKMLDARLHAHELLEALRRWVCDKRQRPPNQRALTNAWLGLGTYTAYKRMQKYRLMEEVHPGENPGPYDRWWKLTPKGARVVRGWLKEGFTFHDYTTLVNTQKLDAIPRIDSTLLRVSKPGPKPQRHATKAALRARRWRAKQRA